MEQYDWDSKGEVPDNLQAVSWMDGANVKIKL